MWRGYDCCVSGDCNGADLYGFLSVWQDPFDIIDSASMLLAPTEHAAGNRTEAIVLAFTDKFLGIASCEQ
jgi:hypothetical protein